MSHAESGGHGGKTEAPLWGDVFFGWLAYVFATIFVFLQLTGPKEGH